MNKIIIVIKSGIQCKVGRERFTPHQFEDLSPQISTNGKKEEIKRVSSLGK